MSKRRAPRRHPRISPNRLARWWDAFAAAWNVVGALACDRRLTARRLPRPWCATCLAYGPALRPRPMDGHLFLFCERCDEVDAASNPGGPDGRRGKPRARQWERVGYCPIDEAERDSSFRILRAASRFEWVTSGDLRDALGVPDSLDDKLANNSFSSRISFLTKHGFLRRRHVLEFFEYQITDLGRERIKNWTQAAIENKRSIAA